MSDRIKKFSEELDELIAEGEILAMSLEYKYYPEIVHDAYLKQFGGDDQEVAGLLKSLPSFLTSYQSWYSVSGKRTPWVNGVSGLE